MAKVNVIGNAIVVTSALKLEDIKTIEKYRPAALVLKGGEDNKEEIFRIATTTGENSGDINRYGAVFNGETHDEEKKATLTMVLRINDPDGDKLKSLVADQLGAAIMNLNVLETSLTSVLEDIKVEREKVLADITIA